MAFLLTLFGGASATGDDDESVAGLVHKKHRQDQRIVRRHAVNSPLPLPAYSPAPRAHASAQDALMSRLEQRGEFLHDLRHDLVDMSDQLEELRMTAGKVKAQQNVAKATTAVLHLADTFDTLDKNASGGIDAGELRRGLGHLGLDSHSPQAEAILKRYTENRWIDIKTFTTLVRDVHLLLTFDQDGSGTLDAKELKPALEKLGLSCSDHHCEAILRAWDSDKSGKLDLLEFTDLVRSLQTFCKYDKDGSGDIDVAELRPALRRMGLPSDTAAANSILRWYDADQSGRIELHEFAVLARDIAVFNQFDADANGALDPQELLAALDRLGLSANADEVARVLAAWDENGDGTIDLLEFAALVHDFQVFAQFDRDCSGAISAAELRQALRKLGVNLNALEAQQMLDRYDDDKSGQIELNEFRRLAEDLPSLIAQRRAKGEGSSFGKSFSKGRGPFASASMLALPDEIYRNNAVINARELELEA